MNAAAYQFILDNSHLSPTGNKERDKNMLDALMLHFISDKGEHPRNTKGLEEWLKEEGLDKAVRVVKEIWRGSLINKFAMIKAQEPRRDGVDLSSYRRSYKPTRLGKRDESYIRNFDDVEFYDKLTMLVRSKQSEGLDIGYFKRTRDIEQKDAYPIAIHPLENAITDQVDPYLIVAYLAEWLLPSRLEEIVAGRRENLGLMCNQIGSHVIITRETERSVLFIVGKSKFRFAITIDQINEIVKSTKDLRKHLEVEGGPRRKVGVNAYPGTTSTLTSTASFTTIDMSSDTLSEEGKTLQKIADQRQRLIDERQRLIDERQKLVDENTETLRMALSVSDEGEEYDEGEVFYEQGEYARLKQIEKENNQVDPPLPLQDYWI